MKQKNTPTIKEDKDISQKIDKNPPQNDQTEALEPTAITELLKNNPELGQFLISIFSSTTHSGPLPPSKEFRGYEETLAGSGNRILQMAETQQNHRIAAEQKEQKNDHHIKWMQIGIIILCLSGAFYFGLEDKWIPTSLFAFFAAGLSYKTFKNPKN